MLFAKHQSLLLLHALNYCYWALFSFCVEANGPETSVQSNININAIFGLFLRNPTVQCSTLPEVDLSHWVACDGRGWSEWSAYTRCFGGYRRRSRTCDMACAQNCVGDFFDLDPCSSQVRFPVWGRRKSQKREGRELEMGGNLIRKKAWLADRGRCF